MKNSTKIVVSIWYDSVTPESAEMGDYESTGNDMRNFEFDTSPEGIADAAAQFIRSAQDIGCDPVYLENHCFDVLYGEPRQDYQTGGEDTDCICISVESNESIADIKDQVNAEIDQQLILLK